MVLSGWAWFLWCLLRFKEQGCLAILQFPEEAAGDKAENTRSLGCLALSCSHNTLEGLFKVRRLGTTTLKLPELGP